MYCFFFNDTATTEVYTLSLHDALPIWPGAFNDGRGRLITEPLAVLVGENEGPDHLGLDEVAVERVQLREPEMVAAVVLVGDRKSTRLNSSHANISYAVFCLKIKRAVHH